MPLLEFVHGVVGLHEELVAGVRGHVATQHEHALLPQVQEAGPQLHHRLQVLLGIHQTYMAQILSWRNTPDIHSSDIVMGLSTHLWLSSNSEALLIFCLQL